MDIQSANQQHPVPQNVMEVEFKLIGDLTIRQFTYLVVFSGILFLTYNFPIPALFKYPLLIAELIMGLGFAFVPINDVPMDKMVSNYIVAINRPRIRVWKHTANTPYFFTLDTTKKSQEDTSIQKANPVQRKSLEELLTTQKKAPNFNDESDIDEKEKEFMQKLGLNYKTQKPKQIKQEIETEYNTQHQDELEMKQHFTNIVIDKTQTESVIKPTNDVQTVKNQEPIKTSTPSFSQDKLIVQKTKEQPKQPEDQTQKEQEAYLKNIEELNKLKEKLLEEIGKNQIKIVKGREKEIEQIAIEQSKKTEEELGKLKNQNKELADKLKQLQQNKKPIDEKPATTTNQIAAVKAEEVKDINKPSIFTGFIEKLQENKKEKELPPLERKKDDLFEKLKDVPNTNTNTTTDISKNKTNLSIVKGSAQDMQGTLLPECIIIIKNEDNDPVRALKSNRLGQFETTSPLPYGRYKIEGIKDGYEFNGVEIEALGNEIPPVKIVGKKV